MSDRPRWEDDKGMLAWLEIKLDEQLAADLASANRAANKHDMAIHLADQGDLSWLRSLHPDHARFINSPKRPRGKHRPRVDGDYQRRVRAAARTVPRIRRLWQEHFEKRNRASGYKTHVEDFAAALWGVDADAVRSSIEHPSS